jgi:drug/metabolite transporter (DMT)-like permease
VATVIAAGILLSEAPSPAQLAGVVLIVVGLLVAGIRTGTRPLSRGSPVSEVDPYAVA